MRKRTGSTLQAVAMKQVTVTWLTVSYDFMVSRKVNLVATEYAQ